MRQKARATMADGNNDSNPAITADLLITWSADENGYILGEQDDAMPDGVVNRILLRDDDLVALFGEKGCEVFSTFGLDTVACRLTLQPWPESEADDDR